MQKEDSISELVEKYMVLKREYAKICFEDKDYERCQKIVEKLRKYEAVVKPMLDKAFAPLLRLPNHQLKVMYTISSIPIRADEMQKLINYLETNGKLIVPTPVARARVMKADGKQDIFISIRQLEDDTVTALAQTIKNLRELLRNTGIPVPCP